MAAVVVPDVIREKVDFDEDETLFEGDAPPLEMQPLEMRSRSFSKAKSKKRHSNRRATATATATRPLVRPQINGTHVKALLRRAASRLELEEYQARCGPASSRPSTSGAERACSESACAT